MNKITIYFRESYKELLEKVTWPTWSQLQSVDGDRAGCDLADHSCLFGSWIWLPVLFCISFIHYSVVIVILLAKFFL